MSRRVSEILLASVIAARATSYLFSKLILQGMGIFNLMAVRFLLAFALLAALFFPRLKRIDRRSLLGGAVMGALYFLTMAAELKGLQRVPTSTVSFLENTAIVWVPLFAAALSRREPEKKTILSAALCLAGVGLLTLSSALGFGAGEAWCIAAALLYASAILTTDRLTHGKLDALAAGIVQVGTIGLLGLVSTLLFESPRLPQGGGEWLGILALAVVCTGFGFTLQPVAQRGTTAERAGLFCAVNPMVAAALGAVILHETLTVQSLAGMALILLGIFTAGLTEDDPASVFAGRFPPMLLQIPCKSDKDSLRAFHCLSENLLRKNCFAPHSKQFWRDFRCGGRSLADARRGQQSEKHPKGLL